MNAGLSAPRRKRLCRGLKAHLYIHMTPFSLPSHGKMSAWVMREAVYPCPADRDLGLPGTISLATYAWCHFSVPEQPSKMGTYIPSARKGGRAGGRTNSACHSFVPILRVTCSDQTCVSATRSRLGGLIPVHASIWSFRR